MDFAAARLNMVESQVRPNGVTHRRLLAAMADLPREAFVPQALRGLAYMDEDVPLKNGRKLMEPMTLARLVDLAEIGPDDKVLVVGCATGYGAAVAARLAREVVALEQDAELSETARTVLAQEGIANVAVLAAPHAEGAASLAPFDAIVVEGRIAEPPPQLIAQLREGGRLVAVVGSHAVAKAMLWTRVGNGSSRASAFDAAVAELPGFERAGPSFVF